MSQLAPYEKTIVKKMGQLAAPDMMDSIWENVEARLNIELPVDKSSSSINTKSFLKKGKWVIILGAAIVVVIFLLVKNRQKKPVKNTLPSLLQNEQKTKDSNNATSTPNRSAEKKESINRNIAPPAFPDTQVANTFLLPWPDSPVKTNTLVIQPPEIKIPIANPVLPQLKKDSIQNGNKKKGVQDITDDDYKIKAVKKDST